jgi:hypothetical protein
MFVTLTCTRFERSLSPVLDVLHEWLDSWSGELQKLGSSARGDASIRRPDDYRLEIGRS